MGARELGDQQGQDRGRGDRSAQSLEEPGRDQNALAVGQAAPDRSEREHDQPDQEHPLATEQVAQPAGQEQEAPERDHVGVDHPGQVGLREAEVPLQ